MNKIVFTHLEKGGGRCWNTVHVGWLQVWINEKSHHHVRKVFGKAETKLGLMYSRTICKNKDIMSIAKVMSCTVPQLCWELSKENLARLFSAHCLFSVITAYLDKSGEDAMRSSARIRGYQYQQVRSMLTLTSKMLASAKLHICGFKYDTPHSVFCCKVEMVNLNIKGQFGRGWRVFNTLSCWWHRNPYTALFGTASCFLKNTVNLL